VWDRRLHCVEAVVEREQGMATERNDDSFFFGAENG
jgi:hypothetical protein